MRDRTYALPVFLFCLVVAVLLFLFGWLGWLRFVENSLQNVFFPVVAVFHKQTAGNESMQEKAVHNANTLLAEKDAEIVKLQSDNKALYDQFQTTTPSPQSVLPAAVVGENSAVPNISFPEELVINKGSVDRVGKGYAVVADQQLVGIITDVSSHFSLVRLITNTASSLSVQDEKTGAIGIVKGQGSGSLLLDNVLLSDTLQVHDVIVSSGSKTVSGKGIPSNLILGRIVSIDKKPSSLFQSAQLAPIVSFDRLTAVFVIMQ